MKSAAYLGLWALLLLFSGTAGAIHLNCVTGDVRKKHEFVPNCEGIDLQADGTRLRFRHNRLGLRDRDYSSKPAKGTFRVLFVSASIGLNFSDNSGVVPALRKSLAKLLKNDRGAGAFKQKFSRIEIISAAEAGYDTVQSYIRLQELVPAYKPHLVIFWDLFGGNSIQEFYNHATAEGRDNRTGLVTWLGSQNPFWPLPISWSAAIWAKSWARQANIFSEALRMGLLKIKLKLRPAAYCPGEDGGCILRTHIRYIEAMEEYSKQKGAKFLLLTSPSNCQFDRGSNSNVEAWYKSEWVMQRFFPWGTGSDSDEQHCRSVFLGSPKLPVMDVGPQLSSAQQYSQTKNPGEYHLNEASSNAFGSAIARKVYDSIKQLAR